MAESDSESAERFKDELKLAIGGAILYMVVSKISSSQSVNKKTDLKTDLKTKKTDLKVFLVALSMGTMFCITLAQFIPEAFGESIVSFFSVVQIRDPHTARCQLVRI